MGTYTRHPRVQIGDVFSTNNCGKCTVISFEGTGSSRCSVTVRFNETGTIKTTRVSELRRGQVRDAYCPSVFGIGYLGEGPYKGNHVEACYNVWYGMMTRVYSGSSLYPTYADCSVDPRWHNFQTFAAWYYANHREGYRLDKDVLGTSRTYGPDTCAYIPSTLNGLEARLRQSLTECPEMQEVYDLFLTKVRERINHVE